MASLFSSMKRGPEEVRDEALVPERDAALSVVKAFLECGPEGRVAAILPEGACRLLDPVEAALLDALTTPRDEAALAAALRAAGWESEGRAQAGSLLAELEARGLVRRLGAIVEEARKAAAQSGQASPKTFLTHLGVPTRDRPMALRRALSAWGEVLSSSEDRESASRTALIVADDSRLGAAAGLALAEAFASGQARPVYYLDAGLKRGLAEELAKTCGEVAAFALGLDEERQGLRRYGAARNFLLLAGAGATLAMADDDIVPDFRVHPASRDGVALGSGLDPSSIVPFATEALLASWARKPQGDPMAPHRSLLGRFSRDALLEASIMDLGKADFDTLRSGLGQEARIAALSFGTWGHSGMPSNRYLLALRGQVESGSNRGYDDAFHESAIRQGLLFRGPSRATVNGKIFAGGHIALDARTLLPPFSPSGADEDGLWGHCLGILHRDLRIAYPREAILHAPLETRIPRKEDALDWGFRLNELLRNLLGSFSSKQESGEGSYPLLGNRLHSLALSSRTAFRETMTEIAARVVAARIGILESALAEFSEEPAAWAADVHACLDGLAAKLEEPDFWIPRELRRDEVADAEAAFAEYLASFGELLAVWPSLFRRAMEIAPDFLARSRV